MPNLPPQPGLPQQPGNLIGQTGLPNQRKNLGVPHFLEQERLAVDPRKQNQPALLPASVQRSNRTVQICEDLVEVADTQEQKQHAKELRKKAMNHAYIENVEASVNALENDELSTAATLLKNCTRYATSEARRARALKLLLSIKGER